MKIALCSEVIRDLDFVRQCELAGGLGYDGLEIAPFTLGDDTYLMPQTRRSEVRRALGDAGIVCSGLHWLLAAPAGLSITSADPAVREKTLDVMRRLVGLCADLGGSYLVHGSPQQRRLAGQPDRDAAIARAVEAWAIAADEAARAGVIYLIEPLARASNGEFGTELVNTVADAAAIIEELKRPSLKTMIDACAAADAEDAPFADVIAKWVPAGHVAHIHFNDRNRRGPGEGDDRFAPALRALEATGYDGWIGLEPFIYAPDGPTCAARSIGYVRGIIDALEPAA